MMRLVLVLCLPALLCGCYRTDTTFDPALGMSSLPPRAPASVYVTEGDITDHPYRTLGDISVSVAKPTLFSPDPTRDAAVKALRERAAGMGADAVVLLRFGTVGIALDSWGVLKASGRAVAVY